MCRRMRDPRRGRDQRQEDTGEHSLQEGVLFCGLVGGGELMEGRRGSPLWLGGGITCIIDEHMTLIALNLHCLGVTV